MTTEITLTLDERTAEALQKLADEYAGGDVSAFVSTLVRETRAEELKQRLSTAQEQYGAVEAEAGLSAAPTDDLVRAAMKKQRERDDGGGEEL